MAAVCNHFKYGYCKFKQYCRHQHIETICENSNCEIVHCQERHPMLCKFYENFGRCKFNPCLYKHEKKVPLKEEARHSLLEADEKRLNGVEMLLEQKCLEIENLKKSFYNVTAES